LESLDPSETVHTIAADLDRDGVAEILSGSEQPAAVGLWRPDGAKLAHCADTGNDRWAWTALAVGNLDADDDGEFVAAGDGFVAICDADGTTLKEVDVGTQQPALIGLAQLDADAEVEILLSEDWALIALDDDLTVLWEYALQNYNPAHPFSVADLDGDGLHEVLVHVNQSLHILTADGNLAEEVRVAPESGSSSWQSQPIVVDRDGDGCAEIVVADHNRIAAFEGAECFEVANADKPWSGLGRFAGERTEDGNISGPEPFWLEHNVWQGLP